MGFQIWPFMERPLEDERLLLERDDLSSLDAARDEEFDEFCERCGIARLPNDCCPGCGEDGT